MSAPYEETLDGDSVLRLAPGARHEVICHRLHAMVAASVANFAGAKLLPARTRVQLSHRSAICPDLAVVDTRQGINYVGVLISSDPDFARAWSHYHPIAHFDDLRVLTRDGDCKATPLSPGLLVQSSKPPRGLALEQP